MERGELKLIDGNHVQRGKTPPNMNRMQFDPARTEPI